VLAALEALVEIAGPAGRRSLPVREFMLGVKRTALAPDEMITAITVPVVEGWQGYAKVGVRNAMVIAVASASLVVDQKHRKVRMALGSVGPTVLRCPDAEEQLAEALDWSSLAAGDEALRRFSELVGEASSPITDHRATAEYRRHAVGVLARRLARRAEIGLAA
jgi:CO/xanthine dehydrogenase FAD-binding subunit